MNIAYDHLPYLETSKGLEVFNLAPSPIWVLDLDEHGFWWANSRALEFWQADTASDLFSREPSMDVESLFRRSNQAFEAAIVDGQHQGEWTFYSKEQPVTTFLTVKAILIGAEKRRALMVFVHDDVDININPEKQIVMEAFRQTQILMSSFTMSGQLIYENPVSGANYKHLKDSDNNFINRFVHKDQGEHFWRQCLADKRGCLDFPMNTSRGERRHKLDVFTSRHPSTGDDIFIIFEYDVSELHRALSAAEEAERIMHEIAMYDTLTGLPSLHYIQEQAAAIIAWAKREQKLIAILFVDLDGFKQVNDTYGHQAGDTVLKEVAQRLKASMREYDHIARIGGDEFVILQTDFKDVEDASIVADRIMDKLSNPIDIGDGKQVNISASIGISMYPEHGDSLEVLLQVSDATMYRVKNDGKHGYRIAS